MKLSMQTIAILKHCAKIQRGIVINPTRIDKPLDPKGAIRTIASSKALLFQAIVSEDFPADTSIFNLEEFSVGLTTNTDLDLRSPDTIELRNGRVVKKIPKCDPNLILVPPATNISITKYEERVFLHVDDLRWVKLPKRFPVTSNSRKSPKPKSDAHIAIHSEGKAKPIQVDIEREGIIQSIECKFPRTATQPFSAVFKNANLVLLPGSYEVELSKVGVSRWTWLHGDVTFWIAIEQASSWFGAKARDERIEKKRIAEETKAQRILENQQKSDQRARELEKERVATEKQSEEQEQAA